MKRISKNKMEKNFFFAPLALGLGATRRAAMLLLVMMLTATAAGADSTFSGGSGTEDAPYKISSEADLRQLATDVNGGNSYSGSIFHRNCCS